VSILFAFACAVVYGIADYCGGRAARSAASTKVAFIGQTASLVVGLVVVAIMGTAIPGWRDWLWGGTAGVASAIALGAFYHALSHGAMTVVAPITAVTSAALPVAFGLLTGDRPAGIAYVGMAVAVVAVALVSGAVGTRHEATTRSTVMLAFVAGLGFAVIFVALGRTSHSSGMWPLVASRVVSVVVVGAFVLVTFIRRNDGVRSAGATTSSMPWTSRVRLLRLAALAGSLDMSANVLYLLAVRRGLLSIVVVVAALYPVSTVCLAFGIDRERVSRSQALGMALAVGALVLVSAASSG
jgi:drug/metabolite transporter (DMT)-like permease